MTEEKEAHDILRHNRIIARTHLKLTDDVIVSNNLATLSHQNNILTTLVGVCASVTDREESRCALVTTPGRNPDGSKGNRVLTIFR